MEPTHLSVAGMSLNIYHAYKKRNTPLFVCWLATYSTSLLYHYTKWDLHPSARTQRTVFWVDTAAAVTLYGVSAREVWQSPLRHRVRLAILSFHLLYILIYAASFPFDALVWSKDHGYAERWHAAFHWLTFFQTNVFLSLV
jgi:hypothetical protein